MPTSSRSTPRTAGAPRRSASNASASSKPSPHAGGGFSSSSSSRFERQRLSAGWSIAPSPSLSTPSWHCGSSGAASSGRSRDRCRLRGRSRSPRRRRCRARRCTAWLLGGVVAPVAAGVGGVDGGVAVVVQAVEARVGDELVGGVEQAHALRAGRHRDEPRVVGGHAGAAREPRGARERDGPEPCRRRYVPDREVVARLPAGDPGDVRLAAGDDEVVAAVVRAVHVVDPLDGLTGPKDRTRRRSRGRRW